MKKIVVSLSFGIALLMGATSHSIAAPNDLRPMAKQVSAALTSQTQRNLSISPFVREGRKLGKQALDAGCNVVLGLLDPRRWPESAERIGKAIAYVPALSFYAVASTSAKLFDLFSPSRSREVSYRDQDLELELAVEAPPTTHLENTVQELLAEIRLVLESMLLSASDQYLVVAISENQVKFVVDGQLNVFSSDSFAQRMFEREDLFGSVAQAKEVWEQFVKALRVPDLRVRYDLGVLEGFNRDLILYSKDVSSAEKMASVLKIVSASHADFSGVEVPSVRPNSDWYQTSVEHYDDESVVHFYSLNQPYGEFSNFARYPIVLEGKVWPTTEHYFQAKKFAGTAYEERVRHAAGPREAADLGRDRTLPLRSDWEQVKDQVMLTALRAKFSQHDYLSDLLLSTSEASLVEHTSHDSYWGDGGDGSGRNMLGKLLVQVRKELRENKFPAFWTSPYR